MKAKGSFMFKSLEERQKGEFTDKSTGEVISYDTCYVIVADDIEDGNKERRFKFDFKNTQLAGFLKELNPYTEITIEFDVIIYSSNAKLIPTDVEIV